MLCGSAPKTHKNAMTFWWQLLIKKHWPIQGIIYRISINIQILIFFLLTRFVKSLPLTLSKIVIRFIIPLHILMSCKHVSTFRKVFSFIYYCFNINMCNSSINKCHTRLYLSSVSIKHVAINWSYNRLKSNSF